MRWTLLAASAAIAAALWLPGQAAQPAAPAAANAPEAAGAGETITFAQYRDWRDKFTARRRDQLTVQLADASLTPERKAQLEQVKAYYDKLAALPETDRDRLYRQRFDQIDADHDGTIDRAERAAWHDKRRALYRSGRAARQEAAAR